MRQDVDPIQGEIKMTDLYTKFVLTVIAAALSVNVLISCEFICSVHAATGIQKVQICDGERAMGCANILHSRLMVR